MAKQKSKVELLKDIQLERRGLEKILSSVPQDKITQGGVVGEWSVKDILAHLAAWEQQFLNWYESGLQETIPDIDPVGMNLKSIDALNQQIFTRYQQVPIEEVLTLFRNSYHQILAEIEAIPEEDMFQKDRYAWTGKWTLADFIAGNTCNHYRWARTKIRNWLKTKKT